jgi:hypothetical protein
MGCEFLLSFNAEGEERRLAAVIGQSQKAGGGVAARLAE